MTSAGVAAVVAVLFRVDDCFASQVRVVLVAIQHTVDFGKMPKFPSQTEALYVSSRSTLSLEADFRFLISYPGIL